MRIAILDDYQGVALRVADWSGLRADIDVFREHLGDAEAVVATLQPYDVVVTMRERTRFDRAVLSRLPALRLLVVTGTHNTAVDLAACAERGITVSGTGLAQPGATAELTWALILAAVRRLPAELASMRAGGWVTGLGVGLNGATLGIVGLGGVGSRVAEVGRAFGMNVVAWSRSLTAQRAAEAGAVRVEPADLFAVADVVSLHLTLTEQTRGLVGEALLRAMKPTAWLVNTSRGPVVDEAALLRACRDGWIAGAALDVYDQEPLPAEHPLRTLDNVITTPHLGYVTERTYATWYGDAVADIAAFVAGTPLRLRTA